MRTSPVSVATVVCALMLAGCTGEASVDTRESPQPTGPASASTPPSAAASAPASASASPSVSSSSSVSSSPSASTTSSFPAPSPTSAPEPVRFRASAAMADVRLLAGQIGPRLTTSAAYRAAGRVVARRFAALEHDVRRQWFTVPAGDSWGVPVEAGRSFNVIATPPGFDEAEPHRIVGAHLDTVARAPGAEDNASGVAVLLELARLAASADPRLPTVFVAFGGEEPRGSGDDLHHFGSRHYVRAMSPAQRDALASMLSLDRVGVGSSVPVCTGPLSPPAVMDRIIALSRAERIPAHRCELTTSDHWSFEKAGYPVARLGSTPYAAYHSEADLPRVVSRRQLDRVGRLAWTWLTAPARLRASGSEGDHDR